MIDRVYNLEQPLKIITKSIFLLSSDSNTNDNWEEPIIKALEDNGFNGTVFINKNRNRFEGDNHVDRFIKIRRWRNKWLDRVDAIIFCITGNPTLTDADKSVGFEEFVSQNKAFVFTRIKGMNGQYTDYLRSIPMLNPNTEDIDSFAKRVLEYLDSGATRQGPERNIPLEIWKNNSFAGWLQNIGMSDIGEVLKDISPIFSLTDPSTNESFLWIVKPTIYLEEENRTKDCEIVIGRPDICSMVIYTNEEDPRVVLVSEFRPSVRNITGRVTELPSGSYHEGSDALPSALAELKEEAGLLIGLNQKSNAVKVGAKQMMSTLCATQNIAYKMLIDSSEMDKIEEFVKDKTFGLKEESEITYVEVRRYSEILRSEDIDWSVIGIISSALLKKE